MSTHNRFIALLRGINVGGNNIIRMTNLKACFESLGFERVSTYIQSGNVLFNTGENDQAKLIQILEKTLSEQFSYTSRVVIVSHAQLKTIVEEAPPGFGQNPADYKYDVMFLKEYLSATEAIQAIKTTAEVDTVYQGERVLYFARLAARLTQSSLPRLVQHPVYQHITIRNWNTTTKLLVLCKDQV